MNVWSLTIYIYFDLLQLKCFMVQRQSLGRFYGPPSISYRFHSLRQIRRAKEKCVQRHWHFGLLAMTWHSYYIFLVSQNREIVYTEQKSTDLFGISVRASCLHTHLHMCRRWDRMGNHTCSDICVDSLGQTDPENILHKTTHIYQLNILSYGYMCNQIK